MFIDVDRLTQCSINNTVTSDFTKIQPLCKEPPQREQPKPLSPKHCATQAEVLQPYNKL